MPVDKKERQAVFSELSRETRTIIVYEAPHRLVRTLGEFLEALGDRKITVCRELTKKHETAFHTTIAQALTYYRSTEPKGECVLVIEGKNRKELEREAQDSWKEVSILEWISCRMNRGRRPGNGEERCHEAGGKG